MLAERLIVGLATLGVGLISPLAHADSTYEVYSKAFLQNHYRAGLPADRDVCGLDYCKNRYEGFNSKDTALRTGWLLAWLAKDYHLGLHDRSQTAEHLHRTLDALLRLGKYTSKESITLLNEIRRLGLPTVREELDIRLSVFQNLPTSGYLLRSDIDSAFDRFIEDRVASHDLDPDLDYYVSILFGMMSVKKFVNDPGMNKKISEVSVRIFNTLQRMDFELVRPWDLKAVEGRSKLKKYRYPIYTALRFLVEEPMLKPVLQKKGLTRMKWNLFANGRIRSLNGRCNQNLWIRIPLSKCSYDQAVSVFMMEAFLSVEEDSQLNHKNRKRFERVYLGHFLNTDLNPVLAAVAKGFYGLNNEAVQNAFRQLDSAPVDGLPNTSDRIWKDFFTPGSKYRRPSSQPVLRERSDSVAFDHVELSLPSQQGEPTAFADPVVERSGLDYLMPQVFRLEN